MYHSKRVSGYYEFAKVKNIQQDAQDSLFNKYSTSTSLPFVKQSFNPISEVNFEAKRVKLGIRSWRIFNFRSLPSLEHKL